MANSTYIPMLIVGQDTNGNYIHIKDADENNNYFCPCCHQPIKIRAKTSKKVQPHFYHTTDSPCVKSESIIHWTYKNWLFKKGSQFKLTGEDELHIVEKIDIENIYHTKFGDYQPDITVYDTNGIRFFFEINYSNKKKYSNYADKWCELNTQIIEINAKELIDSSFDGTIPEFKLLFKDGKYFGRLEKQNDSDAYVKLQERKNIVNSTKKHNLEYMNRLDSVWKCVQKYTKKEIDEDEFLLLSDFENLDYEDQSIFAEIIKRMKCIREFKKIPNLLELHFIKIHQDKIDIFCKQNNLLKLKVKSMQDIKRKTFRYLCLESSTNMFRDKMTFLYNWKTYRRKRDGMIENGFDYISNNDLNNVLAFSEFIKNTKSMIKHAEKIETNDILFELYPEQTVFYDQSNPHINIDLVTKDKKDNTGITCLLKEKFIMTRTSRTFLVSDNKDEISDYLKNIDHRYSIFKNINYLHRNYKQTKGYQKIIQILETTIDNLNKKIEQYHSYELSDDCTMWKTYPKFNYRIDVDKNYERVDGCIYYGDFIVSNFSSYKNIIKTSDVNDAINKMYNNFLKNLKIIDMVYEINEQINYSPNNCWRSQIKLTSTNICLKVTFVGTDMHKLNSKILFLLNNDQYTKHFKYDHSYCSKINFSTMIALVKSDFKYYHAGFLDFNKLICDDEQVVTVDTLKENIAFHLNDLINDIEQNVKRNYHDHEMRIIATSK